MKSSHEFCAGVREKEFVIRLIKQGFMKHSRGSEACAVPLRFAETAVVFGCPDAEVRTEVVRWAMRGHLPPQAPSGNGSIPAFKMLRLTSRDTMSEDMAYTPLSHTHHAPPSPTSQLSHLETQRDVLRDFQCTSSQFITGSLLSPYQLQNLTLCLSLCYRPDIAYTQSSWLVDYLI